MIHTFDNYHDAFHAAVAIAKQTGKVQEINQWESVVDGSKGFDVSPVHEGRRGAWEVWVFPDGVAHRNFYAYNPQYKARLAS